jgi:hypothetical protein
MLKIYFKNKKTTPGHPAFGSVFCHEEAELKINISLPLKFVHCNGKRIECRVARWFGTKIVIWVNFGGSCTGRCWCILWTFSLFYGNMID